MSSQAAATVESPPAIEEDQQQKPSSARPRRQPPYAVVVFNDEDHTFQYVIESLMKVFGYPQERCYQLTLQIHQQGRGIVWSGTRELAELKRDQLRSAGPDFFAAKKVDFPLQATVEPLPE